MIELLYQPQQQKNIVKRQNEPGDKYLQGKENYYYIETSLSASFGHKQLFHLICQPFCRPVAPKHQWLSKKVVKLGKRKGGSWQQEGC